MLLVETANLSTKTENLEETVKESKFFKKVKKNVTA